MHAANFKETAVEVAALALFRDGRSAEPAGAPRYSEFAVEEQVLQFLQLGFLVLGEADHDPAVFNTIADRIIKLERG